MQTFKKILLAATVATIASAQLFAASPRRGFAVVIDARSYEEARRQVDDYAAEIGKSGLEVHFVIDRTASPIRSGKCSGSSGVSRKPRSRAPCSSATSR